MCLKCNLCIAFPSPYRLCANPKSTIIADKQTHSESSAKGDDCTDTNVYFQFIVAVVRMGDQSCVCVHALNKIAKQIPKILADLGKYVVIELEIGVGQLAIRIVAGIAVRAWKCLHPG